uniref:Uncharacterized protein n=1 Tax=Polytomella parva TaxID=51329 RepID=A0A7S0YDU0_9CHLO|eukprot:CAMPEP_0175045634 /NCGR_PEP_ID=MMETSP0052_2-20121109/4546_1 /TAXON_ID=51329 ORGANISM="Polytomella parva, Strain SAG 63-3" /NCGR_SAMPLE_ID=MMETSP0052_2 /ASSEMBLY_ACC=CAM_ASM_000194 /LENGTH=125 /DNA_ID=CAMNT_0016309215 /DNA_START=35 /DNA_END=412 /DNA_ORIENTATION=-
MQALRAARSFAQAGVRRAHTVAGKNADEIWGKYFPKPQVSAETTKKNLNKELVGFALLGPAGAGFMLYDFVVGLEEEHECVIPPYPWMRIRRLPGMPWGENGLFERNPRVAKEWPPADGAPASHH